MRQPMEHCQQAARRLSLSAQKAVPRVSHSIEKGDGHRCAQQTAIHGHRYSRPYSGGNNINPPVDRIHHQERAARHEPGPVHITVKFTKFFKWRSEIKTAANLADLRMARRRPSACVPRPAAPKIRCVKINTRKILPICTSRLISRAIPKLDRSCG